MDEPERARYRIFNRFLSSGFIQGIITETLNMYNREEDMSDSPLIRWGRKTVAEGAWWHGVEKASPGKVEQTLQKRQRRVIDLYLDMKNNGYNDSVISIFFNEDGEVQVYDGFHRLSIMSYLGMEALMNCEISVRKTDFPLVETVMEINSGNNLYQPCDDPRLKGFHVWRPDSFKRLKFVLDNVEGDRVLDIGCSEGFFSRELAKRGFHVTALDLGRKRLAVTRYLSIINNLELEYYRGYWQDYIENKWFDCILFFSVFHHDILSRGVDGAFKQLEKFRGKTKQVFFESPVSSQKISWVDPDKKMLYDFTEEEFKSRIEEATEMTVTETWYGIRPVFLLEAS